MSKLKGKVAVVTGASKGIGASIAKALAAEGAAVAVNYASSRTGADKVVAEIEKAGGKAVAIQADMSKSDDISRLFAETKQALGTPNVLVNNAGVFQFDPLEQVKPEEFHRQFNINVLGPIRWWPRSRKKAARPWQSRPICPNPTISAAFSWKPSRLWARPTSWSTMPVSFSSIRWRR